MFPYLRSEIHRLSRRRMAHVLLILIVVMPLALYAIQWFSIQQQLEGIRTGRIPAGGPVNEASVRRVLEGLRPDRAPEFGLGMAAAIGVIFGVILAGSSMGNEFGWATVRTVLAHGGRRSAFVLAKLAALAIAAVVIIVTGFVGTFVASYAVSALGSLDLSLSPDIAARTAGYALRAAYVTLPYIAFAVLMAVLARSAAAGIASGLVLLLGESLVAQIAIGLNAELRSLFDAGISRNLATVVRTPPTVPVPVAQPMPGAVELSFALFILAVWVIAFVALTVHRFAKRDLTLA